MRAAVLGAPVSHSLSPVLHRAAYTALGLAGWSYQAIECDQAGLPGLVGECGPDWAGLSLTMPLKEAVLPLLDTADPLVAQLAAANTLVFENGARQGFNTDVAGIVMALTEAGAGSARPVVILGGGATARAALAAARELGASEAVLAIREPARAGGTLAAAQRLGIAITLRPFMDALADRGALLISTVPAGAADQLAEQLAGRLPAGGRPAGGLLPAAVLDVVYHPWPTRLALAASRAGAGVIGGFEMLLHQAARQVELMTGRPAPIDAMRTAGYAELTRRGRNTTGGQNALLLRDDKSGT